MLLRSIRLEGWRCFANPIKVAGLSEGLNVLYGPNGCGKSTLMMALVRAIFDRHNSSGKDVEALRPAGRSLSPQVSLEFEHGEARYKLEKGFLEKKGSELSRWEQNQFTRLMEGRQADDFLRTLLGGEEAKQGITKFEHWGLAQMLWVPQGKLEFTKFSAGIHDVLQQAISAQLVTAETTAIQDRISAEYETRYTPTGKLKSGANAVLPQLQKREEQSQEKLNKLRETLRQYEATSANIEKTRQISEQAKNDELKLTQELSAIRGRVNAFVEMDARVRELREQVKTTEATLKTIMERRKTIESIQTEIQREQTLLTQLQTELPRCEAELKERESQYLAANQALEKIRSRQPELERAKQEAHAAREYVETTHKLHESTNKLAAIQTAEQRLAKLHDERSQLHSPTPQHLEALRKAQSHLETTKIKLDAALITLTIEPEQSFNLDCLAGDEPGTKSIIAGEAMILRGSPEVAIHLAGIGVIRASGPAGSVDALRSAHAKAEEEWNRLNAMFSGASLDTLAHLLNQAQELDAQLAQQRASLKGMLGSQSRELLDAEQAALAQSQAAILANQPQWQQTPPDAKGLQSNADALNKAYQHDLEQAQSAVHANQLAFQAATNKLHQQRKEIDDTSNRLKEAHNRLALQKCDGPQGTPREDGEREQEYTAELMARDTLKGKLAEAEKLLAAIGEDPRPFVSELEGRARKLRQQVEQAQADLTREEERLAQLANGSPYSLVAEAEEEWLLAQQAFNREKLAADAIKLLYDTLQQVQQAERQTVMEPVKLRTQQSLQRIMGNKFEQLTQSAKTTPEKDVPQFTEGLNLSLDQLSGGEREQVYFAVRFALAEIAFPNRGELVVLDDVFAYTDSARIEPIKTMLTEMAERFQIVLLTCHPERYRGLEHAKFFDVEQLALGVN